MPELELLTTLEVAALAKINRATVVKHALGGAIRFLRFGRRMRFRRSDVEAWINGMLEQAPTKKGKRRT